MQAPVTTKQILEALDKWYPEAPEIALNRAKRFLNVLIEQWHERGTWRNSGRTDYRLKPGVYRSRFKRYRMEIRFYEQKVARLNAAGIIRRPMTLDEFIKQLKQ